MKRGGQGGGNLKVDFPPPCALFWFVFCACAENERRYIKSLKEKFKKLFSGEKI